MRFKAFESISEPKPLQYEDFLAGSDFSNVSPTDLLNATAECFQASKSYVDHLTTEIDTIAEDFRVIGKDELKQLTKVAVGNSVYLLKLRQKVQGVSAENGSEGTIEFDMGSHKQFCTIKVS